MVLVMVMVIDSEVRILLSAIVHAGCTAAAGDWRRSMLANLSSSTDTTMFSSIVPTREAFVFCAPCDTPSRAYFNSQIGVVVCDNYLPKSNAEVAESIRHELVHAFDHCRVWMIIDLNN
jgi:hypothetical protein